MTRSAFHHVELWVPDLTRASESWGWLLKTLGWQSYQHWADGRSWRHEDGSLGTPVRLADMTPMEYGRRR